MTSGLDNRTSGASVTGSESAINYIVYANTDDV